MDSFKEFSNRNILITGGLGFIGSALARRLVRLDAQVTLVDSLIPQYGGNLFNIHDIKDQVTVNITDVRDPHAMAHIIQGQDFLFNLADRPAILIPWLIADGPRHQRVCAVVHTRSLP